MKSNSILLQGSLCRYVICGLLLSGMLLAGTASSADRMNQSRRSSYLFNCRHLSKAAADSAGSIKGVKMSASDSSYYDKANHLINLYGHATVVYNNVTISGDLITIDETGMKAYVKSLPDAQGHKTAHAVFNDDSKPALTANSLVVDLKRKQVLTSQP